MLLRLAGVCWRWSASAAEPDMALEMAGYAMALTWLSLWFSAHHRHAR